MLGQPRSGLLRSAWKAETAARTGGTSEVANWLTSIRIAADHAAVLPKCQHHGGSA
jgi:hypothetical protein